MVLNSLSPAYPIRPVLQHRTTSETPVPQQGTTGETPVPQVLNRPMMGLRPISWFLSLNYRPGASWRFRS